MNLRPYQERVIAEVRQAIAGGCRAPLVVSPTGSGKTVMFSHIADGAGRKSKRVWILVHRAELVEQTSRTMRELGVRHGVIAAGWPIDPLPHVQVVSVQTVVRRVGNLAPPDLIIVDECHHAAAGTWATILGAFPQAVRLGFTATPERLDGKGLAGAFDALIRGPEVAWLIEQGFLTRPVYYAPPSQLDLDGLKVQGGDYQRGEVAARMDKPTITGDAIDHYRRLCPGAPAVVFCSTVVHAEHVAQAYCAAGFRAAVLDGNLDRITRRDRVKALADGRLQLLVSCEIVSEGFDIPVVTVAQLLRPTKSLGMHLQQVGRVLRLAPGKDRAIILDHVGNCLRHGLAEEEREWTLEGRPKKSKKGDDDAPPVRQCPSCFACHEPAPVCPECGHLYQAKPREIVHVSGNLVELKSKSNKVSEIQQKFLNEYSFDWFNSKLANHYYGEKEVSVYDRVRKYSFLIAAQWRFPGLFEEGAVTGQSYRNISHKLGHILEMLWMVRGDLSKVDKSFFAEWTKAEEEHLALISKQEQGQAQTLQELIEIGRARKYRNAVFWARRVWNARQGKQQAAFA